MELRPGIGGVAVLWARNAEHAEVLARYIGSEFRKPEQFGAYAKSLQKLPAVVLAARNREVVVRPIERSLASRHGSRDGAHIERLTPASRLVR